MATLIPVLLAAWWVWLGYGWLARRAVWSGCGAALADAVARPGRRLRPRATGYTLSAPGGRVLVSDGPLGPATVVWRGGRRERRPGWPTADQLIAWTDPPSP